MKTLTVNIFGGPGAGKTTLAFGVFTALRRRGISADFAMEYAKDLVGEGNLLALSNQIHVFGEQHRRITRYQGMVAVVVTDSPLLLTSIYGKSNMLSMLALDEHKKLDNLNYIIARGTESFEQVGRLQTLEQAKQIDNAIRDMLSFSGVPGVEITRSGEDVIISGILERLKCQS